MPINIKRILMIIALLLITILIAFGLYQMFKRSAPIKNPTPSPTTTTPTGQLPIAGERPIDTTTAKVIGSDGQILPVANYIPQTIPTGYYQKNPVNKINADFAAFPSLNKGGVLRYHNAADGKFYRILPDGTVQELSDQIFYNIQKVTWGKTKDIAILEYPDGAKIIYNFETKKQTTIPKHWEDFSFSPDSNELAAKSIGLSTENRWLITFNNDGTGTKLIEPMGENADKVQVDWSPSRQVVAFSQTGEPLGVDRKEVLLIGLNGENFKSTVVEGNDFRPQWSPTGNRLLYSVYSARSSYQPELWIVDAYGDNIGNNRQALKINTWADKCVFQNNTTIYCAVPQNLPDGAGMLPDLAAGLYDDLYKIDLKTGLKTAVPLGGNYTINNISFDTAGEKIYFTSTEQTGIFEIKL